MALQTETLENCKKNDRITQQCADNNNWFFFKLAHYTSVVPLEAKTIYLLNDKSSTNFLKNDWSNRKMCE